jgi:predicted nuclease with TOPRIM domain
MGRRGRDSSDRPGEGRREERRRRPAGPDEARSPRRERGSSYGTPGERGEAFEGRREQVEEYRDRVADRLDRVDERLDRLEERLERLEGRV